ncbi:cbb3-type cytochrome oxidase assembly protein CcoS [Dasania marina]|uniref:cbb3-type cytochrome oxidase assembly protein CcoS n=1 Tax=Dasania marina TaxID=471499 RepID=UPI000369BF99|nr:cbb3-type cytochrome oxidase assembly protein CcoS [Dasania marina]
MDIIYLLIPIALIFTAIAVKLFFWAVDSKQFDDLDSAGQQILFDDQPKKSDSSKTENDNHD